MDSAAAAVGVDDGRTVSGGEGFGISHWLRLFL